jgi:hypothetical protein
MVFRYAVVRCPLDRCSGLVAGQLTERSVPTANLSLIGVARHPAPGTRHPAPGTRLDF